MKFAARLSLIACTRAASAQAEVPVIDALALCMPFVAVTRFAVDVPLDLRGLDAGTT